MNLHTVTYFSISYWNNNFIFNPQTDGQALQKMLWTFATFKVITWAILVAIALEANWFKDPLALAWKLFYFEAVVTIVYILVVHLHSRNLLIKQNYCYAYDDDTSEA